MHGVHDQLYNNEQDDKAITAPILEEPVHDLDKRLREKGLI
jgi:hypothetical protein